MKMKPQRLDSLVSEAGFPHATWFEMECFEGEVFPSPNAVLRVYTDY